MLWGLVLACASAMFAWSGFTFATPLAWTDPKIALVTVGVVIAWFYRYGQLDKKLVQLVVLYALCMVPGILHSYGDGAIRRSFVGIPGYMGGNVWTAAVCASGLLLAACLDGDDIPRLKKAVLAMGVLESIHCLVQYLGADPFHLGTMDGRPVGLTGSPIDSAAILVAVASLSPTPGLFPGLWATFSRGGWAGGLLTMFPVRYRVLLSVFLIGACFTGMVRSSDVRDVARVEVWKTAIPGMTWTGEGPCSFLSIFKEHRTDKLKAMLPHYAQAYAHNALLEAICTKGALGLLGLSVFLYFPSMAGMWVISMFNPISFEATFIACVVAGIRYAEGCE